MAYTTINKSSLNFNTKLYTGNGSTNNITGVGFQPDWVWTKCRSTVNSHRVIDAVRGVTKAIVTNSTGAEFTEATGLSAFGSDGYTLNGNLASMNTNNDTYASWNWKANGQGSSNTAGSINTTYTSVNTTAGFSISQYTGTGSNATVGHGLGAVPKIIIVKKLSGSDSWTIYHSSLGATKKINFDTGGAGTQSDRWNDTSPTNTLFSIGTNGSVNANNATYVAYCFAEKQGYSKFSSYVGNSNADGPFVYTGFKPAFVLLKSSTSVEEWVMFDNKRLGYNPDNNALIVSNSAEATDNDIDFLSNGFKLRRNTGYVNDNGRVFIYMAFGQSLVGTNNVPCTTR